MIFLYKTASNSKKADSPQKRDIIFIDGPDHDKSAIAEKDRIKREYLENNGYIVLSFNYREQLDWLNACANYPSVFGCLSGDECLPP